MIYYSIIMLPSMGAYSEVGAYSRIYGSWCYRQCKCSVFGVRMGFYGCPGGSLEYFVYGGVHPIILGNKLLWYPILMGS